MPDDASGVVPAPAQPTDGDRPLPLAGITVLDLGQIYQGPYCGFLLAMSGARVIKVEPPRGEGMRARGPTVQYAMLNSSKEAVTCNLKDPAGRDLLLRLAEHAEVVLTNFAPGVPERLGIGPDAVWAHNPSAVYAQATGFGVHADDPVPAMDVTVQAHVGAMSVNGFPDMPPVKNGVAFIDFLGGTHLYGAITTALFERERTGRGRLVEISMAEAAYFTLCSSMGSWHETGTAAPVGNKHGSLGVAPYDVYECADGWVAMLCVNNRQWHAVLDLIGRADLHDEPRFTTNVDRALVAEEVDGLVAEWTRRHPKAEVASALQAARVPAAAVREIDEVVRDPAMHRRGALRFHQHPTLGEIPLPHSPLRWHDSALADVDPAHDIGQDNEAVYGTILGLTPDDLDGLKADGVI